MSNSENKNFGFYWGLGALILVVVATLVSLFPNKERINTLADEPKTILTVAAIPASLSFYFWICFFLGEVNLGSYLAARAEYLKERQRKEHKILDQLLELQVKISGGSLNND